MREQILHAFLRRWDHINAMTLSFAQSVPDEYWHASPHAGFAPFCKQLRHVVCVRGVYSEGLLTKHVDFSRKHGFYAGSLERRELIDALDDRHTELIAALSVVPADLDQPQIELLGKRLSYVDYLYGYVQHEAIHHGQWSLYAAVAGYDTPELWRQQWGLGSGQV